ncbi:hypothetical protein NUACC21_66600 [Scytonema sp. NUACC21]
MTSSNAPKNANLDVDVNVNPPSTETRKNIQVEEFRISSDTLVPKIQELIHQATIRRVIVKTEDEYTLLDIPLTAGVVGGVLGFTLFLPIALIGTIGAAVTRLRVVVERAAA